ncbi:MAG: hypothetical protein K940chlam7_01140 [Chlamydiae bacterium]|nr:hypothetical protein [Chlamydiota bacterium]
MSNRTISYLLLVVIVSMGALFALNFINIWRGTAQAKYLAPNEVKGMDIEHDDKLYTLNFSQQNQVLAILNQTIKVGYERYFEGEEADFEYTALVIYLFDGSSIKITPVGFINRQLLLRVPEWNPQGLIREIGPGDLHYLLSETYDP